jgi:hypothetical protein
MINRSIAFNQGSNRRAGKIKDTIKANFRKRIKYKVPVIQR